MKCVKTEVTYKVPDWQFCNHSKLGKPTKDVCRFCVKHGKAHVCVMHNMPLDVTEGILINKCMACVKATAGFRSVVEDTEVRVDPKDVMRLAINKYRQAYSQLISQGYPADMADKLAYKSILGGM